MIRPFNSIFILVFSLVSQQCFSQIKTIKGSTITIIIPYAPAKLNFLRNDSFDLALDTVVTSKQFKFSKLEPSNYSVMLVKDSGKSKLLKNFTLRDTTDVLLTIENSGPCLYNHPKDYEPKCPFDHFNNIIPIINGLPTPEEMKLAEKGEVLLAGCVVDACSPTYYCKIHKVSF